MKMIQNVLMTALTPLSSKSETQCWENRPFTTVWPTNVQPKSKEITRTIKKKPKRVRTAFSMEQLQALENTYSRRKYIDSQRRLELAKALSIGEKCIKIWFQNRRMKEKKESSESSCESSCESFGNETISITASPPLHIPEEVPNDYKNIENVYPTCNNMDYSYQLPTYYTNNEISSNMYAGMQTPNISAFYTEDNVYPTQYYPANNSYNEGGNYNGFYQITNDVNNYWPSNHHFYYAPI